MVRREGQSSRRGIFLCRKDTVHWQLEDNGGTESKSDPKRATSGSLAREQSGKFGEWVKVPGEVFSNVEETQHTGDGDVKVHYDEVTLVSESDADAGEVAVVVSLEDTATTDDAVVAARWLFVPAQVTPSPAQRRFDVRR